MANYNFVVDSTFRPFTFDEMVKPLLLYKEAYDKAKEEYKELEDAEDFSYLLDNTVPEDDRARQIYEGYINERNPLFDDFSRNGLSVSNQRGLLGLRSRYRKDIGRLKKADELMKEIMKTHRDLKTRDDSIIFASEDYNLSDYLDGNVPNNYYVSGNSLYTKGAIAGEKASKRIYSNPIVARLSNQFLDIIQEQGYSPEKVQEFRNNIASIPELQRLAIDIAKAEGLENLGEDSDKFRRGFQQIINGIADGVIYQRSDTPKDNKDYISAAQAASLNYQKQRDMLDYYTKGIIIGKDGSINYDPTKNVQAQSAASIAAAKKGGSAGSSSRSGGSGSSTTHNTQMKKRLLLSWDDDPNIEGAKPKAEMVADDTTDYAGEPYSYDDLPEYARKQVDRVIADGTADYYDYYLTDYKDGGIWNDTEAKLEIVPRGIETDDRESLDDLFGTLK